MRQLIFKKKRDCVRHEGSTAANIEGGVKTLLCNINNSKELSLSMYFSLKYPVITTKKKYETQV